MKGTKQPANRLAYTYVAKSCYWRFRYKGLDAPLPGVPGDACFQEKYADLLARFLRQPPVVVDLARGTFDHALRKFYADAEFLSLAKSTQGNYLQFGKIVSRLLGDCLMEQTTVDMIGAVRSSVKIGYRRTIRCFISRLYVFASDRGYVTRGLNVAERLRPLKPKKGGHEPWSNDEIAKFFEYARGSVRTLIIIALCTGQRASDIEQMSWSQVLGDFVRVRQRKTGELLEIPLHPMLRRELDRLRSEGLVSGVIVRKPSGCPTGGKSFEYQMRKLVKAIPNMPRRTPHGARYATAAILQDAGCDVEEIVSIIGHRNYEMAIQYATKRKLALRAMAKMIRHAALADGHPKDQEDYSPTVSMPMASCSAGPARTVRLVRAGPIAPVPDLQRWTSDAA
ncbi:tyrosine-type recombinase/integrase [Sphingomonas sp. UYP23]